jgi:hypothetical protein
VKVAHRSRAVAVVFASALALLTLGCGSRSGLKAGNGTLPADGAAGSDSVLADDGVGATASSGGQAGSGGVTGSDAGSDATHGSGGSVGLGGMVGSAGMVGSGGTHGSGGIDGDGGMVGSGGVGGTFGTGGSPPDASTRLLCGEDGGRGLPAVARQCIQDSDCDFVAAIYCCSAARAFGVAKSQADAYRGCTMTIGLCGGMGCARYNAYETDTGRLTTLGPDGTMPVNLVSVRCVNQLCTTDAVEPRDAGPSAAQDSPQAQDTDAAPDSDGRLDSGPPCGDSTCGSNQACLLNRLYGVPPCETPADGGACAPGLVLVPSCTTYYSLELQPGCTPPPPTPRCRDLPDACANPCSCLCPAGVCNTTDSYYTCLSL